jgi:hypothetical protein
MLSQLPEDLALLHLFAAHALLRTDDVLRTRLAAAMFRQGRVVAVVADPEEDHLCFKFLFSKAPHQVYRFKQVTPALLLSEESSESTSAAATCRVSGTGGSLDVASRQSRSQVTITPGYIQASDVARTVTSACGRYLCVVSQQQANICVCQVFVWPWTDPAALAVQVSAKCSAMRLAKFASEDNTNNNSLQQTQSKLVLVLSSSIVVLTFSNRCLVLFQRLRSCQTNSAKTSSQAKPAEKSSQTEHKFQAADIVYGNGFSRTTAADANSIHSWHDQLAQRKVLFCANQDQPKRVLEVRRSKTHMLVMTTYKAGKAPSATRTLKWLLCSIKAQQAGWAELDSTRSMSGVKHYCITPDMQVLVTVHAEGLAFWSIKDGHNIKYIFSSELDALKSNSNSNNSKKNSTAAHAVELVGVTASRRVVVAWTQDCVYMFKHSLATTTCTGFCVAGKDLISVWPLPSPAATGVPAATATGAAAEGGATATNAATTGATATTATAGATATTTGATAAGGATATKATSQAATAGGAPATNATTSATGATATVVAAAVTGATAAT